MRWGRDNTGRCTQRPYYGQSELDALCEGIVVEFLRGTHGEVRYPISTDDITNLIESEVDDLDLYADLRAEGDDVQGVTYFYRDGRPRIRIAKDLSEQEWRSHRLRTTLTHEYGHAHLHAALWPVDQLPLFPTAELTTTEFTTEPVYTHLNRGRNTAGTGDWMEWQAGYASGSLLMPVSAVHDLATALLREWGMYGAVPPTSPRGRILAVRVGQTFDVSIPAAVVRLERLGYLGTSQAVDVLPGLGITD